ncbi:MAG: hypothetical protein K1Y36_11910 [Blastocatellia bacterium]|nr:hypothetical protein [Blastocatellia bacterium]
MQGSSVFSGAFARALFFFLCQAILLPGLELPAFEAVPQAKPAIEMYLGWMYWAPPQAIPDMDWYLVVAGTVETLHRESVASLPNQLVMVGTLRVKRIFRHLPTRNYPNPQPFDRLRVGGLNGLKPGDNVLLFAIEYDGGYGLLEAAHSNCKIGIKLHNWHDPIVASVERMCADYQRRKEILAETREKAVWQAVAARRSGFGKKPKKKEKPHMKMTASPETEEEMNQRSTKSQRNRLRMAGTQFFPSVTQFLQALSYARTNRKLVDSP